MGNVAEGTRGNLPFLNHRLIDLVYKCPTIISGGVLPRFNFASVQGEPHIYRDTP